MKYWATLLLLTLCNHTAADEPLDPEFLEWLGQTTEITEIGIDVEALIAEREQQDSQKNNEAVQ